MTAIRLTRLKKALAQVGTAYNLKPSWTYALVAAPFIFLFAFALLLVLPPTREVALWLLDENRPVELLTFVALLGGGVFGLALALRLRGRVSRWTLGFYSLFALALFVVGMEEVAWGQSFFKFETPPAVEALNAQGELTLHNLEGLQGHSELFRLLFGVGGLGGVWLGRRAAFRAVAAPTLLLPWFLVISAHAALDAYDDLFPFAPEVTTLMRQTSEVVELLIGIAGLLYLWLNARKLTQADIMVD